MKTHHKDQNSNLKPSDRTPETVINSCRTEEQLAVAYEWSRLHWRRFKQFESRHVLVLVSLRQMEIRVGLHRNLKKMEQIHGNIAGE